VDKVASYWVGIWRDRGDGTAVVERRWIGGSCPNIACLPSKNEIWSARVAHLVHHAAHFGTMTGAVKTDMAKVRQRKRDMVNREIDFHLKSYKTSGAELIMGTGRFVGPKTLEVRLNDGGTRELAADQVFLNVGTHAAIPKVPGLEAARPLTHIEALELDYLPPRWRCSLRKQGFAFYISGGYVPGKSFLARSRIMESSSSDSLGIASILMSHGARSSQ